MKNKYLQTMTLLSVLIASTNVMAHGDHSIMTPDHGLEHMAYYGLGIIAGICLFKLGRKFLRLRKVK